MQEAFEETSEVNFEDLRKEGYILPFFVSLNKDFNCVQVKFSNDELLTNEPYLDLMTRARKNSMEMYFNRFIPSQESTINYLKSGPLTSLNHFLLLIEEGGVLLGHFGFKILSSNQIELDNVMRIDSTIKGQMSIIINEFIAWIKSSTEFEDIVLRVMNQNASAINLYTSLGFKITNILSLRSTLNQFGEKSLLICDPIESDAKEKMVIMSLNLQHR
jgi:hypothetical protein